MLKRYLTSLGQKKLLLWLHFLAVIAVVFFVFRDASRNPVIGEQQAYIKFLTKNTSEPEAVNEFYQQRDYLPVWFDEENRQTLLAKNVLSLFERADDEGLEPRDYLDDELSEKVSRSANMDSRQSALSDYLFTKSVMRYISHMHGGKLRIPEIEAVWPYVQQTKEDVEFLAEGLRNDDLLERLIKFSPQHEQYQKLKKMLHELRQGRRSKAVWTRLPDLGDLKFQQKNPKVVLLRQRLIQAGDLPPGDEKNQMFDNDLKQAIMRYQYRNGLPTTGQPGPKTTSVLNVPVEKRIEQIIVNMERWRHVPLRFEPRHVVVNVPGFELMAIKNGVSELSMRVIIGEKELPTPVFSARLDQVILNPEWHVPRTIAIKEMLEKIHADANYLTDNNLYLTRLDGDQRTVIDPAEIPWPLLGENYFPYEIHQRPGRLNPLGKYKFSIPNRHDVYLHDTPFKSLFKNNQRDMSHGCVRLESPEKLAQFILGNDSYWTPTQIAQTTSAGQQHIIHLRETVPVDIVYFTAWVNQSGQINFFPDVYALDEPIAKAVFKPKRGATQ